MVDAVLLEWEGVLADTRPARRDALRRALSAEGVAHTLSDDDEQLRGLGVRATVRVVMRHIGSTDATLAELLEMRARREFAATLAHGLVLADGAAAFVERVQSRARLAIVSRASRDECDTMLQLSGLEPAVSTIVCASDTEDDAPSASLYRQAMSRLARIAPGSSEGAVAIVDRGPAIRAAREAGVRVIAVGSPACEAMDADVAVEGLGDVPLESWRAPGAPRAAANRVRGA